MLTFQPQLLSACRAPRRDGENTQTSQSLPSPNDSGACDSYPGPQFFFPKSAPSPDARGYGGAEVWPGATPVGGNRSGWLDLCRVSPTRAVRARPEEKVQTCACRLGEETRPLGSARVGVVERVQPGRPARLQRRVWEAGGGSSSFSPSWAGRPDWDLS